MSLHYRLQPRFAGVGVIEDVKFGDQVTAQMRLFSRFWWQKIHNNRKISRPLGALRIISHLSRGTAPRTPAPCA
jgi:hypothetical protein